jgi:endo-1,4-beta-xylanase
MNQFKIFLNVCLAIVLSIQSYAQPDKQLIQDQAAAAKAAEIAHAEKLQIEQEYLTKAHSNIEQYRKGDAQLVFRDSNGKPISNLNIEINQITQDFLFGNIVFDIAGFTREEYKVEEYKEKYKALFNLAVFPFYWSAYERTPGKPEWQRNQAALDWCLENRITCKGHPLGWTSPSGTPDWLLKQPEEIANELYKARIYNNVLGYKGKIDIWDVVNEPVNTVPWHIALADTLNNNNLRYNMHGIGIDDIVPWVDQSYRWAHEANPEGNYILNEYFTLAIPEIRDRFYNLLKALQSKNTPITGIGIQGHEPREMWFSPVEMYKTFDLYSEFGLPLHITEFIPQSSGKPITGWRSGVWTEAAQAEFAKQFYTLAFGYPTIQSITWWGFTDRQIWLEGGGLLDKEFNPKPVYQTLIKLIKEEWMTKNLKLITDKDGMVNFRGFFGAYQVKVKVQDDVVQTFDIFLHEDGMDSWCFEL